MDCSPSGISVHGIFQARTLEWVAISFSRGYSWPRDPICISCVSLIADYYWATGEPLREYHKQLYANEKENLEEIDKFLEMYHPPKLNQEEMEDMNRPTISTEIETLI